MRILLIIPPMTQLNAPYAAVPCLAGFLRRRGLEVAQVDASLELALRLFSREGLSGIAGNLQNTSPSTQHFLDRRDDCLRTIEPVIHFLQGADPCLAYRIAGRQYLPEGPRFAALDQLDAALPEAPRGAGLLHLFGRMGTQDLARYLASLYLDDLADAIHDGVDPRFELSRYAEKLALNAVSFDPLRDALEAPPTFVDRLLEDLTAHLLSRHQPDLIGWTVPFPGNLYGALRMARKVRHLHPACRLAIGGGYINTELRELQEPRLFDYVDYVTLDDGEIPLLNLAECIESRRSENRLCRTFLRKENRVAFIHDPGTPEPRHAEKGGPDYAGLAEGRYLSLCELPNPMHRLWSEGRWNKLMLAHGCYWKKCAFCDTRLDYIRRYDPSSAACLVDQIESLMQQTGQSGFHFTDEAASPALLKALAEEIMRRDLSITWWGNIRFEKAFSTRLIHDLARSGCTAVTGGLETAGNRLLTKMNKGITIEESARILRDFVEAGILVHAYLMYGFPSQTTQETVDALETVRQLFQHGLVQSAYWHRFALTLHSPMAQKPSDFGIQIIPPPEKAFARNELAFVDSVKTDHDLLGKGLRKALYNYLHGVGLEEDVRCWFDARVPKTKRPKGFVARALRNRATG